MCVAAAVKMLCIVGSTGLVLMHVSCLVVWVFANVFVLLCLCLLLLFLCCDADVRCVVLVWGCLLACVAYLMIRCCWECCCMFVPMFFVVACVFFGVF